MIIKCIECGHNVSDKADKCPNCGCPICVTIEAKDKKEKDDMMEKEKMKLKIRGKICVINGKSYDLTPVIPIIDNQTKPHQALDMIRKITKIDFTNAGCIVNHMRFEREIPETYEMIDIKRGKVNKVPDGLCGVKCPYCGSTSTKKIGTGSRIASTAFFGIASNKIGKSYKCTKCGGTF